MSKDLIDRGTYYEIKDYEPIVTRDEHSNVVSVINCPYIPKFLFAGGELGSTGVLGRMESPGSKRRYREENTKCK